MDDKLGGKRMCWWPGLRAGGREEVLVAWMKSWEAGGGEGGVD